MVIGAIYNIFSKRASSIQPSNVYTGVSNNELYSLSVVKKASGLVDYKS